MSLHRRQFLITGLSLTASLAFAARSACASQERVLSFENLHTGEKLRTAYWTNGAHVADASRAIDRVLRDHRTGDVAAISPRLLDVLYLLRTSMRTDAPFEVISGYRSPHTNAVLARASGGVAPNSLHTRGMAIDIRLPGCSLADLREKAMALKAGGVGYYAKSGFVHVDVGRVRYW